MKKTFVTLFVMLSMLWSMGASAQTLVFHLIDGTTTDIELSSTFRMSTVGNKTIVSLPDGSTKEFSQSDILTVTYCEKRGDVNRDNTVDVADIATIISIMAGEQEPVKTISITTGSVTNITHNSAVVEGTIQNVNSPVNVGVLYGTSNSLSISSDKKVSTTSKGDYTVTLSSLSAGTTYYYCAFAEVDSKYYYGETKNFKTENPPVSITVTTKDATDVKETSVTLNGSVSASNTTKSYTAGFFIATSGTPSYSNYTKKVESGSNKTGSYSSSATGLSSNTTYYYRAYVFYNDEYYYGDRKSFKTTSPTTGILNGHEWVDLGLPSGTKWATCNIGASKPENCGDYFAWGETNTKNAYTWATYQYGNAPQKAKYLDSDISGTDYDSATANWGYPWRMPSPEQIQELMDNCSSSWSTQNGINGWKFTGTNGAEIFLPAAGCYYEGVKSVGESGHYWLSKIGPYIYDAYDVYFNSFYTKAMIGNVGRYWGYSVRAVF